MTCTRRTILAGGLALLAAPALARPSALTDAVGRPIKLPATVTRVFPAGPPAAIHQYALAPDGLLGWPRANRPDELAFLDPAIGARPEIGRLTGRGNTTNLETLISLRPDVIIDIGSLARPFVDTADRIQNQTGIPYALLDGRFASLVDTLRLHGTMIGAEDRANRLAGIAADMLQTVQARIQTVPQDKRPRVYYARGPKGLETALGGSINVETIEFIGARNVAGAMAGGLALVSLEQVLAWDPDVIITIDRDFAAQVRTDPNWASLRAVRDGRVHLAPKMPFGWIDFPPALNRLPGLFWLGTLLYPDLFKDNLAALTRSFYSEFYHRTPNDAQIDFVLAGRG